MTIVLTMVVGDDADILESNLSFHLNAGIDAVVVGGETSAGPTRAILERVEGNAPVRVLPDRVRARTRGEWMERAAEHAASELGADWVIGGSPEEFWWPRGGSLRELLSEIPNHFDAVQALVRPFLPTAEDDEPFAERMVYRLSAQSLVGDPHGPWQPARRLARRVPAGGARGRDLRGWYPIEVLWFPVRSGKQLARSEAPWSREPYASLALDRAGLDRGLGEGVVQLDARLRDALRSIQAGEDVRFVRPSVVENALFAVDAAVLGEADVLAARRSMDELEQRLGSLEANVGVRVERKLRTLVKRRRPPQ
jgi:hypothetical protein